MYLPTSQDTAWSRVHPWQGQELSWESNYLPSQMSTSHGQSLLNFVFNNEQEGPKVTSNRSASLLTWYWDICMNQAAGLYAHPARPHSPKDAHSPDGFNWLQPICCLLCFFFLLQKLSVNGHANVFCFRCLSLISKVCKTPKHKWCVVPGGI